MIYDDAQEEAFVENGHLFFYERNVRNRGGVEPIQALRAERSCLGASHVNAPADILNIQTEKAIRKLFQFSPGVVEMLDDSGRPHDRVDGKPLPAE